MRNNGIPMLEESFARVPAILREHGVTVEPRRDINEFKLLTCARDDAVVLLAVSKPAHWASASDVRRNMVVVAVTGESLLRFWRFPREKRLCRAIVELLGPLRWQPG
jgi:hypothetical protein